MDFPPDIPVLSGALVRLEPLAPGHTAGLAAAAEEDRDSFAFTHVPRAWQMPDYLAAHLERARNGTMAPFAQVRQRDGQAVGVTTYWEPRFWPGRGDLYAIEIGWTWLAASAQRTGINTGRSCCCWSTPSARWVWRGPISRPMPATSSPGAPWSGWAPGSRASSGSGRHHTCRARRAGCATRRCSRSSPANGPHCASHCGTGWPGRLVADRPECRCGRAG